MYPITSTRLRDLELLSILTIDSRYNLLARSHGMMGIEVIRLVVKGLAGFIAYVASDT